MSAQMPEDVPLFDLAPERHYFPVGDGRPFPFCSDCRRKQPFMAYEGGSRRRQDGTTEVYEICESCANDSIARAAQAREKGDN